MTDLNRLNQPSKIEVDGEEIHVQIAETTLMPKAKNYTDNDLWFVFKRVSNSKDWRDQIFVVLDPEEEITELQIWGADVNDEWDLRQLISKAVLHYTGTSCYFNVVHKEGDCRKLEVIADGYRMGPAGP